MSWIDLSARTKLKLSGPDRVRFLNGQVSNQIDQDLSGKAIPACVCNLKGKIEALIWITEKDDALFIDCDAELREELFTRLDRYLIADDCELEDITDDFKLFHVLEKSADGIASERLGEPGKDIWISSSDKNFKPKGDQIGADAVESMRIQRGIPKWGHELTGDELPAELGLDKTAVNFHKGCSLGQEIISRIESVGQVKRTLICLKASGDTPPIEVEEPVTLEGKTMGKITSAIAEGSATLGLALVKRSFTEAAEAGRLPNGWTIQEF